MIFYQRPEGSQNKSGGIVNDTAAFVLCIFRAEEGT